MCTRYCDPIFKFQTSKHEKTFCRRPEWVQAQTATWIAGPNELNSFQATAVKMGLGTKCSQSILDTNVPKGTHAQKVPMGSRPRTVHSHYLAFVYSRVEHIYICSTCIFIII